MEILDEDVVGEHELRYASFWIRGAAFAIDLVIVSIPYAVIGLIMVYIFMVEDVMYTEKAFTISRTLRIAWPISILLYFVLMESSSRQGTIGKIVVGIKVAKSDGGKISFLNSLIRFFSKILSSIIIFIGFIMAASDSKKQSLHDRIANTYVFYGKKKSRARSFLSTSTRDIYSRSPR